VPYLARLADTLHLTVWDAVREYTFMSEKEFEPRLGKIGHKKSAKPKPFVRQVLDVAYKSGFKVQRTSSFTGQRIGRGAAWGTLASAGLMRGGSRRVVIKVRIAKLKAGNLTAPRAHMRYIQRDGVDRSGEPGKLYGSDADNVDGVAFTERCDGDRHQFRIIVSPDEGDQLSNLKPFVGDLMRQMERDLETKLDWVAVDHHNTGHPHAHVVIRGKDDQGHDLIIARDYVTHGIRQRAGELLTLELGPEDEFEQQLKLAREVQADRFTRLDRSILKHVNQGYLTISSLPPQEPETHIAHMRRLRNLSDLGLAVERQTGVWQIDPAMEQKLRGLGKHNDIIATMHRAMKQAGLDRPAGSFAVFRADDGSNPVLGKVAALGLTDEISDRHFVVVDGVDGRLHYADIGRVRPEALPEKGMIVSIEAARSQDDAKLRTRLRIQSYLSFEKLAEAEGVTWLDKELLAKTPTPMADQGFGAEIKTALNRRRQWLISQGLGQLNEQGLFQPKPKLFETLHRREYDHATLALSKELGLPHNAPMEGEQISGTFTKSVALASGKYAVIQKALEFTLVPWRLDMEPMRGKEITGTASAQGIQWEWGPRRGLGI
jgi:type IV secretory pathway VirD2 relaxase